jgi:hypothetical protein
MLPLLLISRETVAAESVTERTHSRMSRIIHLRSIISLNCYCENGQADLAKRYAAKAYELSTAGGTDADRDLATALLKQWPDIAENR